MSLPLKDFRCGITESIDIWLDAVAAATGTDKAAVARDVLREWAKYVGTELGYTFSPVDPADESAELQRQFIDAVRTSSRIADRLTRLGVKIA